MSSISAAFIEGGPVATRRRTTSQRHLLRFTPRHRNAVAAVAARHERLAELAVTFPALLFALAVPPIGSNPDALTAMVEAGAPLRHIARLARLPWWSRRLMPETFHHGIGPLPDSAAVCCEIANHLPRSPKLAPDWLDAVSCTHAWGVPAMPIWIAREISRDRKATKPERLRLVSLYAWYSGAPHTLAGGFIAKPWSASMRYATALDNARNWLECVDLQVRLGSQPIADVWLHPGHVDGFDFVPLRTAEHVRAEGIAMRNCVHTYADNVVHDRSRLWSIRRAGSRVATLEIAYGYEKPLLEVTQLTGAANQAASAAVWWAARRWLHAHDLPSIMITPRAWGSVTLDRSTWVALWRPYWLAKRRLPTWLPLCPSQWALWNI